ncbi:MAG: saccharopine dehydrogenase NADP-binding domain-containing protein [Bacteroidetes bacterium]|nr:saccharopine dehydrogenase NADP-binding domain-containing protein [Bacteroidota bacterium]
MKNITIFGAGMVGKTIAFDLAKNYKVSVIDKNNETLNNLKSTNIEIETIHCDIGKIENFGDLLQNCDIAVCAVPGFMGYETLKKIINTRKNVVDISFFPENPFELDKLAKQNNVTAIVDCGVAPGLDNIFLGYYNQKMKITDFECYVGGLPKVRKYPFYYKAPFSPIDVIEEYTRKARLVENFDIVVKEPLSDCEFLEFDKIGTLEAFNSDGLRTLIHTMPHIKNMKEKTLRYCGHSQNISVLKESGFFDKSKIDINGNEVSPLDFTCKILFKDWHLSPNDEEFTVMRTIIKSNEKIVKIDLYDETDMSNKCSSMSRTTGYTACAAVNLLLKEQYIVPGINPPEYIGGNEDCFKEILNYLHERNIDFSISEFQNKN